MTKYILVDFDDTLIDCNQHLIDAYNMVTSDKIKQSDFIAEFSWDNIATHSGLWKELVQAIVRDPSAIQPLKGAMRFYELAHQYGKVIILSKRYGVNIIRNYLLNNAMCADDVILNQQCVLVNNNEDKKKYVERLTKQGHTVFNIDDRADIIQDSLGLATLSFMQQRPWNDGVINERFVFSYHSFTDNVTANIFDLIKNYDGNNVKQRNLMDRYNIHSENSSLDMLLKVGA